ncbi:hypothetical protein [Curtanaerobium respiraculi]|uniref:hypothetical protein n=1 Tax=Curtanaerobium respiraculi TaxID=2949669 RepID=UPI0024B356C0|nr:hypothetical protein [Curtanaerobium respiraculi]
MPTAELEKLIDGLDKEDYETVVKFVTFLSEKQKPAERADVSKRIGIAEGVFPAPDDLDECNDEIAELFGIA